MYPIINKRHHAGGRSRLRSLYLDKLNLIYPSNQIGLWPLSDLTGAVARDKSPQANHGAYATAQLGQPGFDGEPCAFFNGSDSNVGIGSAAFAADWNGDQFSMLAWGRMDGAARWTDVSTYRYLTHVRSSADVTYYAVMGHSQTAHQLEWRRRSGGAVVAQTLTYSPAGPLDWFCMGMTFSLAGPLLKFFLNDSVRGWRKIGETNNAALTAWGANPPDSPGTSLLAAGSSTAQEWIGWEQYAVIWNTPLGESTMEEAMSWP